MRCGMIVCQFQLADVNEGDGGMCVIPGSHKAAQQAVLGPPYIYNRPLIADDGITVDQPRRE